MCNAVRFANDGLMAALDKEAGSHIHRTESIQNKMASLDLTPTAEVSQLLKQTTVERNPFGHPWEVRDVPGKGKAAFATKSFRSGEEITREVNLVSWLGGTSSVSSLSLSLSLVRCVCVCVFCFGRRRWYGFRFTGRSRTSKRSKSTAKWHSSH